MTGGLNTSRDFNGNWRGGKSLASNGYVLIRVGVDHPMADVRGYVYEHRLVMAKQLGRWLRSDEQVHHRDEDKRNNHPENLEVLSSAEHHLHHRAADSRLRMPGEANPDVPCECGCGAVFPRYDATGRPRRFVSGHNPHPEGATMQGVREALGAGPRARRDLFLDLPFTNHAIAVCLSKLKRRGVVTNEGGLWRLCRQEAEHG
ncbi:MAG TPA: HNH endonuclease [Polyangiaceae bacterium]|nr:HNH endonuclease [Polyangiaceae bacterium]